MNRAQTCEFCGEFFPISTQRNKHKCPFFNPVQINSVGKHCSSSEISISPVKPSNYKLSLNDGRISLKPTFNCELCLPMNENFTSAEELNDHREKMHSISRRELLQKRKHLLQHITGVSSTPKKVFVQNLVKCPTCELSFRSTLEYGKHLVRCSSIKNEQNSNKVTRRELLQGYLSRNTTTVAQQKSAPNNEEDSRSEYKCVMCEEKFTKKEQFFDHTANVHNKRLVYECSICGDMFVNRLIMTRHLETHKEVSEEFSPQTAFECEFCGKQFMYESFYKRHLATHTGVHMFTCDICGDDFRSQNQLVLHRSAHMGDERYPCPVCKKQFAYKSLLERHKKTHVSKPQACEHCGLVFNIPAVLTNHIILEHSAAVYGQNLVCYQCNKKFLYPSYLARHLATHDNPAHKVVNRQTRKFVRHCTFLNNVSNLQVIQVPCQTATTDFHCLLCNQSFKRETTLEKHMHNYHSFDYFPGDNGDQSVSLISDGTTINVERPDGEIHAINAPRVRTASGQEYFAIPMNELNGTDDDLQRDNFQISVAYIE